MNTPDIETDRRYMAMALNEAREAYREGEIPVGAVIVCDDRLLARTHNQTERLHDVTAHAEMLAITAAADMLGAKYLTDCTLYVTLEPCMMCAGALGWSQIGRIVYGASDPRRGFATHAPTALHPKTLLEGGLMKEECEQLMKDFFRDRR